MIFGMTLVDMLGNISVFLVFAWFCSAVLENRFPIISTALGIVIYGIILPVIAIQPAVVEAIHPAIRYAVTMLVFWIYVRIAFEGRLKEKILTYIIGYSVINASQMLFSALLSIMGVSIKDNLEWLLAGSCAMTYGILYMVSKVWKSIALVTRHTKFFTFFLLPICQFALIFLTVYVMGKSSSYNLFIEQGDFRWVPICIGAIFLVSLVADGMVLDGVAKMANTIKEQERLKTVELENKLTYNYVKDMEGDITELRKYRHDILNMLTAVQLTIESGSEGHDEEALSLVRQMTNEISRFTGKHYCECNIVNCILAHAERRLTEQGIKCELRAQIPETLEVSELDLCRVMTNLFDNARESCQRMPEGADRWVRSNLRVCDGYLYFAVHNSCADEELPQGTSKKDKKDHGLGLKIIRELAEKHGGELVISGRPGAVECTVTMRWGK